MRKYVNYKHLITFIFIITLGIFRVFSYMIYMKNNKIYLDISQFKTGILNVGSIILCIVFIYMFFRNTDVKSEIYPNKKALLPYISIVVTNVLVIYILTYTININNMSFFVKLTLQIFLVCCVLIMYPFGIKFSNFKWGITYKELCIVISAFLCFLFPRLIFEGKNTLKYFSQFNGHNWEYLYYSIRVFIYPAFSEEVIFRGLFVMGLKGYGFSNWKINIIQSIIFGLLHFGLNKGFGLISIVFMSSQVLLGYITGLIYFKTKSLTPCILFHALLGIV